mgnify:CR=1 FL=1
MEIEVTKQMMCRQVMNLDEAEAIRNDIARRNQPGGILRGRIDPVPTEKGLTSCRY